MAVETSHPDSASLAASWQAQGYDVRTMTAAEMGQVWCSTPHTTDAMARMGTLQAGERMKYLGRGR